VLATHDTRLRWKTGAFAILLILSNTLGNFSLTWGMKHRGAELTLSPLSYLQAFLSPWVTIGVGLLVLWMLARMALLSWADLSYVVPVTALGYAVNAFLGRIFLHEQITVERWAGTFLIVAGTALVGAGRPQTGHRL
jgi:uncharacterized membrane protein